MRKRETPRALIYKGFQAFLALTSVKLGIILYVHTIVNIPFNKIIIIICV